jgi:dihydrofolate reductase
MRKVVVEVFDYSLDGVIGVEDTEFFQFCRDLPDDPGHEAWRLASFERADVHIMGRKTYEGMSSYYPDNDDDNPYAGVMNSAPKAVFSRTLMTTTWANSTIVGGDLATEIGKLRELGSGEIHAHGGVSFVQSLVSQDLADEYRLNVFPFLAGHGQRLFADLPKERPLELESSTAFGNGVVGMVYRKAR